MPPPLRLSNQLSPLGCTTVSCLQRHHSDIIHHLLFLIPFLNNGTNTNHCHHQLLPIHFLEDRPVYIHHHHEHLRHPIRFTEQTVINPPTTTTTTTSVSLFNRSFQPPPPTHTITCPYMKRRPSV